MGIDFESFEEWIESDGSIPFDMYARDISESEPLQAIFPGIIVSSAGGSLPFQAEGLLEGYPFYLRDRHGYVSLSVGAKDGEMPYHTGSLWDASCETEEFMGAENFVANLLKLIPMLEKAPFLYDFEGKKLNFKEKGWIFEASDETERYSAWGITPEDAYARLKEPSKYLEDHGATIEMQNAMFEAKSISPNPLNSDDRVFPDEMPIFRIITPE